MKQANLFDLFSGKSKKKEAPPSSQNSNPPSNDTTLASGTEMQIEEPAQAQPILTNANENIPAPTASAKSSKKRTSDALDALVQEKSLSSTTELEAVGRTIKAVKIDQNQITIMKEETIKVVLSQDTALAPKDLTKLKKMTELEYNAYHDAPFWPGQNVPFSFMVEAFEEISLIKGENSKEKMTEIICNMFRTILLLNPDQLPLAYYFCVLKIAPDYEIENDLGVGQEILIKAVAKSSGRSDKYIRDNANQTGDLGKVAATSKATQSTMEKFMKKTKAAPITLKQVMETFRKMAHLRGNNANTERENLLTKLLFDAKENEPKYIVRFVQHNLKIGAAEATMQAALFRAFLINSHYDEINGKKKTKPWSAIIPDYANKLLKYEEAVKTAICEYPNYDMLIQGLKTVGQDIDKLKEICHIRPGIPVKPMLAKPTKGINIILQRFENMKFTCEYKYDGLRGQIHYNNGKCQIFSRNLENMTETYPDIVEFVLSSTHPDVRNFIIDSEIVAINPTTQRILPFQQLATRSRKNVDKNTIEIQVCLYVFDILYLNDESLLKTPFVDRRKCLYANLNEVPNKLKFAEHLDTDSFDEIQEFLAQSVKIGCEGLMVKTLDTNSTYEPSRRTFKWLKLKKDYIDDGLGDSFDLVPIGAAYGTGKRGGLYGSFVLATYNADMERYETFCKLGTGFSDEDLVKFHKFFSEHLIKEPQSDYKVKLDGVDVWFEPCAVWEVRGADIQVSPVHTAAIGLVDKDRGLGLRFPRLIKERTDKDPTDATEPALIVDAYKSQAAIMNTKENMFEDDEDLY